MQVGAVADTEVREQKEMGKVFARGAKIGLPVTFIVTFVIALMAHVPTGGAAAIAGWGALIMGPFVGTMLFLCGKVGALGE